MKISRSMAYAVQALLLLANYDNSQPVPCNSLARDGQMPERFLLQILRTLVNSGILNSVRGVEGGYLLARPAKEISLLEIYQAFDIPIVSGIPPLPNMPDFARQTLSSKLNQVAEVVRGELAEVSIADLLEKQPERT